MDNPNVILDEDEDLSEEEAQTAERIRLRPYYDWRVSVLGWEL